MQLSMLITSEISFPKENVKILNNFGTITIINPETKQLITGNHLLIESDEETIINWLKPYDSIWIGEGAPQLQQFSIMHIK